MKIKFVDNKGKITSKEVNSKLLELQPNTIAYTKYIKVYQANQRQANAHTKDRSEVSGGGKKPWRQKGTGRARHGSSRSPIWKGGGVTFGPTNAVNHKLRINKKEARLALATILHKRVAEETMYIADLPEVAKTKEAADYIAATKIATTLTIVTDNATVRKNFSNIPGVTMKNTKDLSAYDLATSRNVIFGQTEFDEFIKTKEKAL